jgi:preprotein translocase subunit SecD
MLKRFITMCLFMLCVTVTKANDVPLFGLHAATLQMHIGWVRQAVQLQGGHAYVSPTSFIGINDLAKASVTTDPFGRSIVILDLKPHSGIRLLAATAKKETTHIAVVYHGKPLALLKVHGAMARNRLAIEGFKSSTQAQQFVTALRDAITP